MTGEGPTLLHRVTAVLHARQYVVFFAIPLYALDVLVPLLSGWLYRGGGFADVQRNTWGPLADAVATRSLVIAGVFVVYVVAKTWLRAGYIRSLTGPLHLGPDGRGQFARLLGLELILEGIAAASVGVVVVAGATSPLAGTVVVALLVVYLAVIYSDYIVVLAGAGPLRAIALSWRTVRRAFIPSALVLLVVTVAGDAAARLLSDPVTTSLLRAAPMLFVKCVAMGTLVFIADVVLIVIYLGTVEEDRRAAANERPSPSPGG